MNKTVTKAIFEASNFVIFWLKPLPASQCFGITFSFQSCVRTGIHNHRIVHFLVYSGPIMG